MMVLGDNANARATFRTNILLDRLPSFLGGAYAPAEGGCCRGARHLPRSAMLAAIAHAALGDGDGGGDVESAIRRGVEAALLDRRCHTLLARGRGRRGGGGHKVARLVKLGYSSMKKRTRRRRTAPEAPFSVDRDAHFLQPTETALHRTAIGANKGAAIEGGAAAAFVAVGDGEIVTRRSGVFRLVQEAEDAEQGRAAAEATAAMSAARIAELEARLAAVAVPAAASSAAPGGEGGGPAVRGAGLTMPGAVADAVVDTAAKAAGASRGVEAPSPPAGASIPRPEAPPTTTNKMKCPPGGAGAPASRPKFRATTQSETDMAWMHGSPTKLG